MATYLHLRQICLVAPHLQPVVSDIAGIMGLDVRHAARARGHPVADNKFLLGGVTFTLTV
jgi:hypothetical protein